MAALVLATLCLLLSAGPCHAAARAVLQDAPAEAPCSCACPTAAPAPAPGAEDPFAQAEVIGVTGNLPPAQDAASYCIANIQAGVVWGNGDGTFMSAVNVFLVNHGISDIQTGWTFSIQNPNYLGVFQAWNWQVDGIDSTGTATGSAHESWETIRASGQNQVNIGAIFKGKSPQNFYPRVITINGQRCYIQQLR